MGHEGPLGAESAQALSSAFLTEDAMRAFGGIQLLRKSDQVCYPSKHLLSPKDNGAQGPVLDKQLGLRMGRAGQGSSHGGSKPISEPKRFHRNLIGQIFTWIPQISGISRVPSS